MNPALEFLHRALAEFGLRLPAEIVQKLYNFLCRLLAVNRQVNLTAVTKWEDVVVKHLLDSLVLLKTPWWDGEGSFLDVGSGAGLPGLPFALLFPQKQIYLLEANKKKARFLQAMKAEHKLSSLIILPDRAETLAHHEQYREKFSLVAARAVAGLPALLELTLPFCRPGGLFVAYKGPQAQRELKEAQAACRILGGVFCDTYSYRLPAAGGKRTLLVFSKGAATPSRYPRRPGIPEKRPLL